MPIQYQPRITISQSNITNNVITTADPGTSLATDFYAIPPNVRTVVAEFRFDSATYDNIHISGQAQVLSNNQIFRLELIKDNDEGTVLSYTDDIISTTPIAFSMTKLNATTGNYQIIAIANSISNVGDAKINFLNLVKT